METYYKVFNPVTGEHLNAGTLDEAKELRKNLLDEWISVRIEEANSVHSVAAVTKDSEGNEIWVAIEKDFL